MNREVKINASINLEGLEEYKAVGALQIAKIKAYKDKVDSMKNIIAEEVAAKGKMIKGVKDKGEARLAELRRALDEARQELSIKNKHLASIKQLAETILDQRAQVEEFFLTAMEHVGSQAKEMSRDSNPQPKTYKDKVDISELDMADK
jgi:3-dehydroquinate synthase class II